MKYHVELNRMKSNNELKAFINGRPATEQEISFSIPIGVAIPYTPIHIFIDTDAIANNKNNESNKESK